MYIYIYIYRERERQRETERESERERERESADPRCRFCGFLNPHGPDGRLMTSGTVGPPHPRARARTHACVHLAALMHLCRFTETARKIYSI